MLRPLAQFLDVAFPGACISCHRALGPWTSSRTATDHLCAECHAMLRPMDQERRCPHCGISPYRSIDGKTPPGRCTDCAELPEGFANARSAYPYDSPAGNIVRNMKYQRAPFLAAPLVDLSIPVLGDWLFETLRDFALCAIPMNPWRQLRKGYNQAEELAAALARRYDAEVIPNGAILRPRRGSPQARHHSHAERAQNVRGAYYVKRPQLIAGRRILLVDDVMTTGATVSAAAEALVEAGALQVFVFTPVRARLGDDADDAGQKARIR